MSFPDKLGSLRHVDVIAGFSHHFNLNFQISRFVLIPHKAPLVPLENPKTVLGY